MIDEKKVIYDISPTISSDLAVFPGDRAFEREVEMDFNKGHHMALSNITTTVHIGAHVDAPNHYHKDGVGIDQRDLSHYLGSCQVLKLREDLNYNIRAKRVLFKSGSYPNPNKWNGDFKGLNGPLIEFLNSKGVITVGIDTPSVDEADSKELSCHKLIYSFDMAIIEGVVLDQVPEGEYFLIALPLKIKDADASPVRAILLGD